MKPAPQRSISRRLSRRTLLRGGLGIGVALPWLEIMMPRGSRAQSVTWPKRFGIFFSPCGTIPENWACNGTGRDFTLSRILQPLEPFKQDLIVIRGVNMESANWQRGPMANVHDQGMTHMLTATPLVKGPSGAGRANHFLDGSAGGISIDQHLAKAIGQTTYLPSLELGVESSSSFLEPLVTRMCYSDVDANDSYKRAVPVPPLDNPVQVYARLFGSAGQGSPEQIRRALQRRQSVLDFVKGDYTSLMSRLGKDDRAKCDQHFTHVREIEGRLSRQLTNPQLNACPGAASIVPKQPERTRCLRDQDLRTPGELMTQPANYCLTNFIEIGTMQMDLMILALACDLTRVASLQWSTAESTIIHTWLPLQYQGTREHHMLTHNESVEASKEAAKVDEATATVVREDLTKIGIWYTERFAYMLGKLKAIQEGEKTLLDNMLFFWTNELGEGGIHSYTNIPYVLAGSCGGQLSTGRAIDFLGTGKPGFGMGPAHNKLFVTFMQLFGVPGDTFGMPDFQGPLAGLL